MKHMAITEFKAKCLAVLEEVARTEDAVVITRRGKVLARVLPASAEADAFPQNELKGTIHELSDDVSSVLPSEDWEMNR